MGLDVLCGVYNFIFFLSQQYMRRAKRNFADCKRNKLMEKQQGEGVGVRTEHGAFVDEIDIDDSNE